MEHDATATESDPAELPTQTEPAPLSAYQQKIADKRKRYAELAHKSRQEANRQSSASLGILDRIPPGQPILVGHHSEKRHRRDLRRADNAMRASIEADEKATYYTQKAESYGNHCISSDDPEAMDQLKKKLEKLTESRERMKAINKASRSKKTDALIVLDLTGEEKTLIEERRLHPNVPPFPPYAFTNLSANIRCVKKRIKGLEIRNAIPAIEEHTEHYTYKHDLGRNRVVFIFAERIPPKAKPILRRHAFKHNADHSWTRLLNNSAIYAASRMRKELDTLFSPPIEEDTPPESA